jgi:hypothetical protein
MKKLDITPALQQMERFIGVTIPRSGKFSVCDHDEVVRITIDGSVAPEVSDEHPYKFVENNSDFLGIVFDGLPENQPILRVGSTAISYKFDPKQDFARVECDVAGKRGALEFRTFSGDWFVASLSEDGRHLVLAEPYEVALYEVN